jgi:hypothetical protein
MRIERKGFGPGVTEIELPMEGEAVIRAALP